MVTFSLAISRSPQQSSIMYCAFRAFEMHTIVFQRHSEDKVLGYCVYDRVGRHGKSDTDKQKN